MENVCGGTGGIRQRGRYSITAQEAAHPGQAANSTEDSWLKDPITNCAVWGSDLSGDNLISWSGDCRDGKANGTGVLSWINDGKLAGRYSGPMVDGKAQGLGTIDFWLDNQYLHYEGSFLNSKLDGWGNVRWPDGSHLEGEFKDDAPSGLVRYKAANGSSYAGEVKNELADGQGHQILPDKEEYYGQFRQGKREGEGVLFCPMATFSQAASAMTNPAEQESSNWRVESYTKVLLSTAFPQEKEKFLLRTAILGAVNS